MFLAVKAVVSGTLLAHRAILIRFLIPYLAMPASLQIAQFRKDYYGLSRS